jgi:hypothetical protein
VLGKAAQNLLLIGFSFLSISCGNFVMISPEEYKYFYAKNISSREIEAPMIYFIFTDNDSATLSCQKLLGKTRINELYLGCANWRKTEEVCSVIVPYTVQTTILGHEVRHCFEGAFH